MTVLELGDKSRPMPDDRLVAMKCPRLGFNGHGQLVERGERRLSIFHMRNTSEKYFEKYFFTPPHGELK